MAGIYIHIPFCKQRCRYCSFFSSTSNGEKKHYIDVLCKEIETRSDYLNDSNIETIYFGGGTPSTLSESDFTKIFSTIESRFNICQEAEITMEGNPDDFSDEYLAMLRNQPFNRISMGVQSFNDAILKTLGRRHDAARAIKAYESARTAGFDNISIDLMFALPGSNAESWTKDLETAIALQPEHISAYNLTYEEGTQLYRAMRQGTIVPLDEDGNIEQFTMLIDRLTAAGYKHYEISNFALPGRESRHNSSYWHNIPYLGCGAAAHSYNGTSRRWNIADIPLYIKGIENGNGDYEEEILSENERYNDTLLTRLRTSDGLPLKWMEENFSEKLNRYMLKNAKKHIDAGTLTITDKDSIRLTKKGIFISDAIIRDLIYID